MINAVILIVVLFAPGFTGYSEFVDNAYKTMADCEKPLAGKLQDLNALKGQGWYYFAKCVRPTPVDSEKI